MNVVATIAIPTYKRPTYLLEALRSVIDQQTQQTYEVLILDNGCDSALKNEVLTLAKDTQIAVRYIPVPEIGLHHSRHTGAQAALGPIVAYIDDDVIAPPNWLEALLEPFNDRTVACVGGKTVPKWEIAPPAWIEQFGANGGIYLSMLNLGENTQTLTWPQGVYGCNMALRKNVIFELDGFHPDSIGDKRRIWLRGDGETGLQRKIYAAGYKIVYEPSAWLYHRVPASRVTPKYFFWRAFIQGISDSYSAARQNMPSSRQSLWNATVYLCRALHTGIKIVKHPRKHICLRTNIWYWYGRAGHQMRLALNPALRQHVIQPSYLQGEKMEQDVASKAE